MRRKFVRGQFKDADDARRTIASLENQRTRQRRRCEQLGWLLGVQEQDLMDDIQHAAFMTVVCARLRNHGKEIPPANLEPVKHGLIVAQELMEYAYEHERQALINVLKHNTHENIAENPGLREVHERFILGKHYEQVRQWELEDDAFLGELQATGKFKEQAEEAK